MNPVIRGHQLSVAKRLDQAAKRLSDIKPPALGWLKSVRYSLNMSAPALAERLGVTKAAIYQAERNELRGGITLQQLEKIAQAMDARLVYAIVPNTSIGETRLTQARKIAQEIVMQAAVYMSLEDQLPSADHLKDSVEQLTTELLHKQPRHFWKKS